MSIISHFYLVFTVWGAFVSTPASVARARGVHDVTELFGLREHADTTRVVHRAILGQSRA